MSATAFAHSKIHRRLCQVCHERKARFAFRGRVKADDDHTLCFECYRAEYERRGAAALLARHGATSAIYGGTAC
jgi:hypothetical protein